MDGPTIESQSVKGQTGPLLFKLETQSHTAIVMGAFGNCKAALIETSPDSHELEEALVYLTQAKCVISVGYAYAFNRTSHKHCDIFVSDCIDGVSKVGPGTDNGAHEFSFCWEPTRFVDVSENLKDIFDDKWKGFACTKRIYRESKVYKGNIISLSQTDKIHIKNNLFRVLRNQSTYLGGDNGTGLSLLQIKNRLADKRNLDIILIKGVVHYGNDSSGSADNLQLDLEIKKWHLTASIAVTHYVKYKLKHAAGLSQYFSVSCVHCKSLDFH